MYVNIQVENINNVFLSFQPGGDRINYERKLGLSPCQWL